MSEKRVNALRAMAGAAVAVGGLIRNARLEEARLDQRDAERDIDDAREEYDDYLAMPNPDPIKAMKLQQSVNDAQNVFNEVQRDYDAIQNEEALWAAASGTATMLDGLGVGNGGGNGGGDGGGDGGGGGDFGGADVSNLLVSAGAGFAGGAVANSLLESGRGRRRWRDRDR